MSRVRRNMKRSYHEMKTKSTIVWLPFYLTDWYCLHLFQYFHISDIGRMDIVIMSSRNEIYIKRWISLLSLIFTNFRYDKRIYRDASIQWCMKRQISFKNLDLDSSKYKISDKILYEFIKSNPNLETFTIPLAHVNNTICYALGKYCPKLLSFSICTEVVKSSDIMALSEGCHELKEIKFYCRSEGRIDINKGVMECFLKQTPNLTSFILLELTNHRHFQSEDVLLDVTKYCPKIENLCVTIDIKNEINFLLNMKSFTSKCINMKCLKLDRLQLQSGQTSIHQLMSCLLIEQERTEQHQLPVHTNCSKLETLTLEFTRYHKSDLMPADVFLNMVQKCPLLSCFGLRHIKFDDDCVTHLVQNCPNLTQLNLNYCSLSSKGLTKLGELKHLRILSITEINASMITHEEYNLTDETFLLLIQNKKDLRSLHIGGRSLLTDESLQAIALNCPNLFYLDIGDSADTLFTSDGVEFLESGCRSLINLQQLYEKVYIYDSADEEDE